MRSRFSLIAGLITVVICLFVYLHEPAFLEGISRQAYDGLLRLAASPPQSTQVVLIDVDEASLKKLGQWPWPRYVLARLLRQLWAQGVSVVAFDMAFAERDRMSPGQVEEVWQEVLGADFELEGVPKDSWDFDAEFAAAMQEGKVVLGCFADWLSEDGEVVKQSRDEVYRGHYYERTPQRSYLPHASSIVPPIRPLAEKASGVAFINTTPDLDSVVRRTPLVCAHGPDRVYPSLALEAVRLHVGSDSFGIEYDESGTNGVKLIRLGNRIVPTDRHGRLVINYRTAPFPRMSAHDVLEGVESPVSLSNAVVLVGTSAAGLRDVKATPLYPELPGFEVQATALENMLSGDILSQPRWMEYAIMAAMLLLGTLLAIVISRKGAIISFGVTLLSVGAVLATSYWVLKKALLVVLPAELVLTQISVYIAVTMVNYFREERARQRVRHMFGTMVSGPVLHYLEEHPESFSLTGTKEMATVFFSDVVGFTSIAEGIGPQQLTLFMNQYLTPVTNIIMTHNGYVDKFSGDGVMAVWGVPYAPEDATLKDHALQACLAAIEQQERISAIRARLEAEFGHTLRVRMGLNTGIVTAGNMGSENRMNFTVMGETVNLASRFESANRAYGTSIMIGETTFQRAREEIEARLLDLVIVKGQTHPANVYELLGRKGEVDDSYMEATSLYEEALRLHWAREWDQAEALLNAALRAHKDDAPSVMLRHRIGNYRIVPPPEEWGGEFIRVRK